MNDENTGGPSKTVGKTSESPAAIRDRSLVVKEEGAARGMDYFERRTALIEEGEAGTKADDQRFFR